MTVQVILSSLKETELLSPQTCVVVKTEKGKITWGRFYLPWEKKAKNLRTSKNKKDSEKETEIRFLILCALVNTLSKHLYCLVLERLYSIQRENDRTKEKVNILSFQIIFSGQYKSKPSHRSLRHHQCVNRQKELDRKANGRFQTSLLVLVRTGFILSVARRDKEVVLYHLRACARGRRGRSPLWPGSVEWALRYCWALHSEHSCANCSLLWYTLLLVLSLLLFVSFFIVVSSKLFLSQPVIFTICASNSPLQPTAGRRGNGMRK